MPSFLGDTLSRFKEGFAYTPEEQKEIERCDRICVESLEAIQGGYSVASRRFPNPEVPDLLDRVRRGLQQALGS